MRKIIEIFKNDVKNLIKSKIAVIIILGICFIPGIYAWLNIISNWGPYDNTGNLPIAIVNKDEGTTILGENVNIGKEMEESLKSNTAMKWIFTDEDNARLNVDNSKYYGAIVIPQDFSKNISTIIENDTLKKPTFDFYVNNKKNPIAPIIVNKAVGTIQNSVNQSFVNTVIYKTMSKVENIDVITKSNQTTEDLIEKLSDAKLRIEELRFILKTADSATTTTSKSLSAIRKLLPTLSDVTSTTKEGINDMKNAAKSFEETYDNIEKDVSLIIDDAETVISESLDVINQTNSSNITEKFNNTSEKLDKLLVVLKRLNSILSSINNVADLSGLQNIENKVSEHITKIEEIQNLLANVTDGVNNLENIKGKINELNDNILSLKTEYQNTVKNDLSNLYTGASSAINNAADVIINFNVSLDNVDSSMQYMINALENGGQLTENIDVVLVNFEKDIDKIIDVVKEAKKSEIYENVVNILNNNPQDVADFLSTPVDTNEIDIYKIDTYGSKMAPFYSILACWVGCTILTAIVKINLKETEITKNAKHYQKFFGRFMLFGLLALIQGLVIGIGDLFLQVQTVNSALFLITLMLSSVVFVLIIYSLAVAFGKVGQALSIVIMVLQVAGSGGTFPIELVPRPFQILQPYMPFYPAMGATRETIGGFYENDYMIYILILLCHIIIPLILGLVISKHTNNVKKKMEKELHETDVIE
ncbi:MAG: YhgE/Pip domain-containing protein [Clostridia bacterium]|nr:YhgE/Pip domain-containing protein [Clostridia bacterium]